MHTVREGNATSVTRQQSPVTRRGDLGTARQRSAGLCDLNDKASRHCLMLMTFTSAWVRVGGAEGDDGGGVRSLLEAGPWHGRAFLIDSPTAVPLRRHQPGRVHKKAGEHQPLGRF